MSVQKRGQNMSNDERIAVLETTINHIDATLLDIRQDMKRMLDRMENRFDAMDKKIDSNFKWLLTLMIGGFVGTWGVLSHVLHWV